MRLASSGEVLMAKVKLLISEADNGIARRISFRAKRFSAELCSCLLQSGVIAHFQTQLKFHQSQARAQTQPPFKLNIKLA